MVAFHELTPGEPFYLWHRDESLEEALANYLPMPESPQKYWLRGSFNSAQHPPDQALGQHIDWDYDVTQDGDSLRPNCDVEFTGYFTFFDMERLAGFRIVWTDNFLSHLRMRKHRELGFSITIFVFHHASLLRLIQAGCVPVGVPLISSHCEIRTRS